MEREKIKAWITRYALTDGIALVDGEVCHSISSKMLSYGRGLNAHGDDWHRASEAALKRAEQMRQDKIASLEKSLAKMRKLSITAPREEIP